jgi:uncharacterized glyoxalase superfamily protein PhnB
MQFVACSNEGDKKLLIDWELAGPDRRFEIRVPDVRQASSFYKDVLGAQETFRKATHNGELVRFGLAVGRVGFDVSSEGEEGVETPVLSLLAAEFGAPYVAVILQVEDPDRVALIALKNGAKLTETPGSENVTVVTDPFGAHWAFAKREPADGHLFSSPPKTRKGKPLH